MNGNYPIPATPIASPKPELETILHADIPTDEKKADEMLAELKHGLLDACHIIKTIRTLRNEAAAQELRLIARLDGLRKQRAELTGLLSLLH